MLKRFAVIALGLAVVATSSSAFAHGRRIQNYHAGADQLGQDHGGSSLPASNIEPAAAPI